MVDPTILNQTIDTKELQGVWLYASSIPRYLTEQITGFLIQNNIQVTQRFTSLVLSFISLLMIFLGIKVLQKVNIIIKIILVVLGISILFGMFIPYW